MCTMRNTKAELMIEIDRMHIELDTAHDHNAVLRKELEAVQFELASLKVSRTPDPMAEAQAKAVGAKPMQPWQHHRAVLMASAKAEAIASGKTVKVNHEN